MKLIKGKKKATDDEVFTVLAKAPPPLPRGKTPAHPRTRTAMVQIGEEFRKLAHFHGVNFVGMILDEGPKGEGGREYALMSAHTCTVPNMTLQEQVAWGYFCFSDLLGEVERTDGELAEGSLASPTAHYFADRKHRMASLGKHPTKKPKKEHR